MARRRTNTTYQATRGFGFPASPSVRAALRRGEHIPLDERGEWIEYAVGDPCQPPDDVLDSLRARGLIEEVQAE